MPNRAATPFMVAMMLVTGVANTLLTKYQDKQCVDRCDDLDPLRRKYFEHPVLQTAQMFVGEMGCWLVVAGTSLYRRLRAGSFNQDNYQRLRTATTDVEDLVAVDNSEHETLLDRRISYINKPSGAEPGTRILLLVLPAICDILATTLMNAGFLFVAASIYQMIRGSVVLFVGVFSVIFIHRHLHAFQWISLVGVVLGVAVVGLAGAIYSDGESIGATVRNAIEGGTDITNSGLVVIGVLLIAGAQIFTATQFVLEEWILANSTMEPILVVSWEGTFGLVLTLLGMLVLHLTIGRYDHGVNGPFDAVSAWRQMTSSKEIFFSSLLVMISIGGFNFFGLSVTRSVSATSRSTINTCGTLFIWIVSLGLGWEAFKWLQVVGFALLVYFTFLFNGIVQPPHRCLFPDENFDESPTEESVERR